MQVRRHVPEAIMAGGNRSAALVAATALLGRCAAEAATTGKDGTTAAHESSPGASWSIGKASVDHSSLPNLSTNANAIAIQHIKIENIGWGR
jgi:hypothetical protein